MTFRQIQYGSGEYREECQLRQRVLRAPLGLNLYDENLHAEKDQLHFGLFDGRENLVACVIAAGQSPTETKIRQMAVAPEEQGKGYGRTLLESVESVLSARGVTNLSMHARKTAAGFYATLGYMTYGNDFIEVGLPHVEMRKRLT